MDLQTASNYQVIPQAENGAPLRLNGYGDARAFREDTMMAEQADFALSQGLIDSEVDTNWSTPWHQKGVLELKWSNTIIKKFNQENKMEPEVVISLRRAEHIAQKKDSEDKAILAEYFADKHKKENSNIGAMNNAKGRKKTSTQADKTPPKLLEDSYLSVILESGTEESHSTSLQVPETDAPTSAASPAVLPNYHAYAYYECASLCCERNLISSGNVFELQARLTQDDINLIQGLPREAKPYSKQNPRDRMRAAPTVPNAPKAPPAQNVKKVRVKKRAKSTSDEDNHTPRSSKRRRI